MTKEEYLSLSSETWSAICRTNPRAAIELYAKYGPRSSDSYINFLPKKYLP